MHTALIPMSACADLPFDSKHAASRGTENLLDATYPDISNPQPRPPVYFTERTILTTCNETVDELNNRILGKFSGVTCTFAGYNKVVY